MNVLVAGAGIGGLTAALALHRAGHGVRLLERASAVEAVGAGLILAPNAVQALQALGVRAAEAGRPLRRVVVARPSGRVLSAIDAAAEEGTLGPTLALARPELHRLLLEALPPEVALLTGAAVEGVREDGDRVSVRLADGRTLEAEALVGADGLNSAVRLAVLGEVPRRYSGTTCWRGLGGELGLTEAVELWGGAARVGLVPLAGGRTYYYLVLTAPRRAPAPGFPEGFRATFGHLGPLVTRLLDGLTAPPPLHHDLEELEAPSWGSGRVLLLGDAAHAMTPNQGQGAAMAIEDALALASTFPDLEAYRALRAARVRQVQLDSRRLGALAHWRAGPAAWLRDTLLALAPAALGQAHYRRLVAPGLRLAKASPSPGRPY